MGGRKREWKWTVLTTWLLAAAHASCLFPLIQVTTTNPLAAEEASAYWSGLRPSLHVLIINLIFAYFLCFINDCLWKWVPWSAFDFIKKCFKIKAFISINSELVSVLYRLSGQRESSRSSISPGTELLLLNRKWKLQIKNSRFCLFQSLVQSLKIKYCSPNCFTKCAFYS